MTHETSPSILGTGDVVLAFDIGGTDIKGALIGETGEIREFVRMRTPHAGEDTAEAVITEITKITHRFRTAHPALNPVAVGLLVPGHVDGKRGIGVYSENLHWKNFPFRERARNALGLPVSFGHDVRAAGIAEFRLGAARPYSDVIVMAIGTGIAGATFVDGLLYTGRGMAGEMGHSRVAEGPHCACGGSGCLEAVASAGAIARIYNGRTGERVRSRLAELLHYHEPPILIPAALGENAGLIGAALCARDLRLPVH